MNDRDYVREYVAVMLAYADGKTIQYRRRYTTPGNESQGHWSTHEDCPGWNWCDFEYRVKPAPKEIEVWVIPNGEPITVVRTPHIGAEGWTRKKFREVIE